MRSVMFARRAEKTPSSAARQNRAVAAPREWTRNSKEPENRAAKWNASRPEFFDSSPFPAVRSLEHLRLLPPARPFRNRGSSRHRWAAKAFHPPAGVRGYMENIEDLKKGALHVGTS